MDDNPTIEITCKPSRNGKATVSAKLPDGTTFTDKVDLADSASRKRFVSHLAKGRQGIDRKAVAAELERFAGELADNDGSSGRPSQADQLVAACSEVELFHTAGGLDAEAFATVPVGKHRETWNLTSKGFRCWLAQRLYRATGKSPGAQAVEDALLTIKGNALHDGPERIVAVRVAEHDGAIYLDLADADWRIVAITKDGWRVVTDSPVRFTRKRGQLALPAPIAGGRIEDLRPLTNLQEDEGWQLFVAWLVAALRPDRPFPVLAVNGEQGSAKSTLCKFARALIDPNTTSLRRPPREERDLMIAATNAWIVAFDNLSGLPAHMSDALCSLATGGGFSTRELFSDAEERLFSATRPILLNGIEDLATRPDLLDRSLCLTLPPIPDSERQEEEALWARFEKVRPRVLGALLDAVSMALRNKGKIKLASSPRMADFAAWIVAAEPAFGWTAGKFLESYLENRGRANEAVIDASILAKPILDLVEVCDSWSGTARELLEKLESVVPEKTQKARDWPANPRKLSGELRRIAPNLRRFGIAIIFGPHSKKGNLLQLEQTGKTPSPRSPRSPDANGKAPENGAGERGERGERVFRPCSDSAKNNNGRKHKGSI